MLSNAYFLAKFRFDTAENEPAKNLQNFAKFANFADPNPLTLTPNHAEVLICRLQLDRVRRFMELYEVGASGVYPTSEGTVKGAFFSQSSFDF